MIKRALLSLVLLGFSSACAPARLPAPSAGPTSDIPLFQGLPELSPPFQVSSSHCGRIHLSSPLLREAFDLLMQRSPSFNEAMERFCKGPEYRIEIVYAEDVMRPGQQLGQHPLIAALFPLHRAQGNKPQVFGVRAVFYTSPLEAKALWRGYPRDQLILDIAGIIGHEIFSHAVPFFEDAGRLWPGPCRDPLPEEDPRASCALRRENILRRELGLAERSTYDEYDLGYYRFLKHSPNSPH